jgi:hypothetical protein
LGFQRSAGSVKLGTAVGAVAQLGERLVCNQEATGSIPVSSTRNPVAGVKLVMQWISAIGGVWLVPIAAILVWGVVEIVKMALAHQERLALIERGIHPDGFNPDGVRKDEPA